MIQLTETRFEDYVMVFNAAKKHVGEQGAAAIVAQVGKDLRMEQIQRERSSAGNGAMGDEQPATEKQLGYLRTLGVQIPKGLSKREASAMIDEATGA